MMNPKTFPLLLNIKRMASEGSERGPLFDRGVLETIAVIERDGTFKPNRIVSLIGFLTIGKDLPVGILTEDEVAEATKFLRDNGWSHQQALEYTSGIDFVERNLFWFKARDENV